MDYVTVRELREKSGEIWQRVDAGEDFVVTRNGKPFALLVHTAPAEVEARLRTLRAAQLGAVVKRMQAQALASGADRLTDDDIQAEIDATRQRRGALVAAEPDTPAYAPRKGARAGHARRR